MSFPTAPMRSLLDAAHKAALLESEGEVWTLNLDQIESHSGKVLAKVMLDREEVGPSTYVFNKGTVLYCKLRPYLNKVVVADDDGVATTELVPLRCDESKVLPSYLAHFLRSATFLAFATNVVAGAKMPRMVMSEFWSYPVPLPPLEQQRRITAILDQAETLRTQRRTALALLDSLTQSLFLDMFGDPVANPKGWSMSPLADASDEIQIGPFGSLLHQEDYVPDGIPLINPMHLKDGKIIPGLDQGITQQKFDELPIYQLKAGDLVMGRRGEMGRCAIVTAEHGPLMCGTGSLYIRPNATTATATYLFHVLTSVSMKAKLEEFSLGATMPNLNKGIVAGLGVSLPPLPLQQTFATHIASIEALKATHRRALAALDALFASLQQRAFAGAL